MAKQKNPKKGKSGVGFLGEVREEMRHVTWPTRQEAIQKTSIVVAISLITGLYLGLLDYGFTQLTSLIYR